MIRLFAQGNMAVDQIDIAHAAPRPRARLDAAPPIPLAGSAVVAFLGRAERGPTNEPLEIRSVDDYRRVFGGHCGFSFLPQVLEHFFLNGGKVAVVVRLANRASHASIEVPAGGGVLRLRARRPGSRETLRVSIDYDGVEQDSERFNLVVQRLGRRPGSRLIEDQELFPAVSTARDDPRFVVDVLQQSELVSLVGPLPSERPEPTVAKHPGEAIPYLDFPRSGTDGEELTDYDIVGSNREGTGLFALDRVPRIDIVCIPSPPGRDVGTTTFVAAERYCERRRALLVWDPPWAWRTPDAALLAARAAGLTSPNVLTYFPRLRPRAELVRFPFGLPACGAVAGLLAAETELGFRGEGEPRLAAALTAMTELDLKQAERLHRFGVNTLCRGPGGNIRLRGNVCLERRHTVDDEWQRLDTRRLSLFVLGSIERATHWVPQKLGAGTEVRLGEQVSRFLAALHAEGILAGERADQSFFVRVRRTADVIVLRLGFAVLRARRFEVYEIRYGSGGMTTRAIPPLDDAQAAL